METELKEFLELALPGSIVSLERSPVSERVSGSIVWSGFADLEMPERQKLLREKIIQHFGSAATAAGILLTYTPHELDVMAAA